MQTPVGNSAIESFQRAVYAATQEGGEAEVRRFSDAALGFSGRSDLGMLLAAHERRGGTPEGARSLVANYLAASNVLRCHAVRPEALGHADVFLHAQVAWTRDSLYGAKRCAELIRWHRESFSNAGPRLSVALQIAGLDLERIGPVPIPPAIADLLRDVHRTVKDTSAAGDDGEERLRILGQLSELETKVVAPSAAAMEPVRDEMAIPLLDIAAPPGIVVSAIEQLDGIVGPQRAAALLISWLQEVWSREGAGDRALVLAALRKLDAMADGEVAHVGVTVFDFKVLSPYDPGTVNAPLLKRFRALEGAVVEELRSLPNEVADLRASPAFSEALAIASVLVRLDGRWSLQHGEEPVEFLVGHLPRDPSIAPAVRASALLALRGLALAHYQHESSGEILRNGLSFAACHTMASQFCRPALHLRELEEERFGPLLNFAARKARQDWADFSTLNTRFRDVAEPDGKQLLPKALTSLSAHYDLSFGDRRAQERLHDLHGLWYWKSDEAMLFGARLLAEHAFAGAAQLSELEHRLAGGGDQWGMEVPGVAPEAAPQLRAILAGLHSTIDCEVGRLLLRLAHPATKTPEVVQCLDDLVHYATAAPLTTARTLPWLKTFHPSHEATLGEPRQVAMRVIDHTEEGLSSRGLPVGDSFDPQRSWIATVGQQDRGILPCVNATMFFSSMRCLAR